MQATAVHAPGSVNVAAVRVGESTISYSRTGSAATVHVSKPKGGLVTWSPHVGTNGKGKRKSTSRRRKPGRRRRSAQKPRQVDGAEELQWWVEGVLAREGEVVTRDGDLSALSLREVRVYHQGKYEAGAAISVVSHTGCVQGSSN